MEEWLVAGDFPDYKLCIGQGFGKPVTFGEKCWKMCLFIIIDKNKQETRWHDFQKPAWGWHGRLR